MTISSKKAFKKGLWSVKIWPWIIFIVLTGMLLYLVFDGRITFTATLYIILAVIPVLYIWSLVAIVKWKKWMVVEAENPKTALEMARSSFLHYKLVEKLAFMGSESKTQFETTFNERMSQIRIDKLSSASHKFNKLETIKVHQSLHGAMRFLLFEIMVCVVVVLLFINQDDLIIRLITGALFVIGLLGIFYTIKSLINKRKIVLEVSDRGMRINNKYYGWGELEVADIVKGDTLIFQPKGQAEEQRNVSNLSMPADYLDELILFYKNSFVQEKDISAS